MQIHDMPRRIYFQFEETTIKNRQGWIEVDTDFTQIYDCINEISDSINSVTTYKLLFWLLKNSINKQNGFVSSKHLFESFNSFLGRKDANMEVTYRTFLNCISELKNAKAITQVGKGHYYFNPHIFWRDEKNERLNFIKDEIKDGNLISYNPNRQE